MTIPSWVKVGAKVVCVDDVPIYGMHYSAMPVRGVIYTISRVEWFRWPDREFGLGVHLLEVARKRPTPYTIKRFRPLISQQDDIAMFKALLAPTPDLVVMPDLEPSHSD